jgi:cellulose biosynthesis protein BcsQ
MNSVVSVQAIESYFRGQNLGSAGQIEPLYLLNRFDPSQQLHVDIRNLLQEQLGGRLLPFVLRSSPVVSEALAEGMTVMDYAPGAAIAEDYLNLANWIRSISAPAAIALRGARWSEQ